ncbi:MAG TPA: PD-(D/E)XK nuclease family protein [Gemmatimonadales bacterium]|nr:PD-(D/E)XK nuclease family protein [Gemmatimonadales bacterium]
MKEEKAHWRVLRPTTWPAPPADMSVSTHAEIDECPRRWALGAAEYPDVWRGHGYPPKLQVAGLAGSVVHLALEIITKRLTRAGVPSLDDPLATKVLRGLGGYTRVVEDSVESVLKRFADNPRAIALMEHAHRTLRGQVPALRGRVQSMLARLRLPAGGLPMPAAPVPMMTQKPTRNPLTSGAYPEVELRAKSIGWKGKADLLVLADDTCEITDFKTGTPNEHHKFQVRVYAALWRMDEELNPSGRVVDRLVLAYGSHDVEVPPPNADEIDELGRDLLARRQAAEAALAARPPSAHPHPETCRYCSVRHMCAEYWTAGTQLRMWETLGNRSVADASIIITGRHGPSSWDAFVRSSAVAKHGQPALLRGDGRQLPLHPGQEVRLISVHVNPYLEEADSDPDIVFTLSATSEVFLAP